MDIQQQKIKYEFMLLAIRQKLSIFGIYPKFQGHISFIEIYEVTSTLQANLTPNWNTIEP